MSSRVGTCSPCHARTRQAVCACTTAAARNYIRVASSSREAGREELERLYQASDRLRYGQKPVPGAGLDNGTEPELIEEEHRFTVRLWKKASAADLARAGSGT